MKRKKFYRFTLILAIMLIVMPHPVSAAQERSFNIWHWNMAGWKIHKGKVGEVTNHVVGSAMKRGADFISLNEVCRNQYAAISKELKSRGWPETGSSFNRFGKIRDQANMCGGQEYGVAMFSKTGFGNASRHQLPTTQPYHNLGDGNVLLCAPLSDESHMRFCTTHIIKHGITDGNGNMLDSMQLNEVLYQVEHYAQEGDTAIVAGDFNAQPSYGRMNNWYSSGANSVNNLNNVGNYRELDDSDPICIGYGERTARTSTGDDCNQGARKIDLIFVREDRIIGDYEADALGVARNDCIAGTICSDHRILTGRVNVIIN